MAPAALADRQWERSGWPWAWVGLVALSAGALWAWRARQAWRLAMAQASEQASLSVARARDDARRREHARMARDFHDRVNDLNNLNLLSGTLKTKAETGRPVEEIKAAADRVCSAVTGAINALEDMIWVSRPENDTLPNLLAHLRQQIGRFREDNPGLTCELDFPLDAPDRKASPELSSNVLSVTSEALRNAAKHAGATQIKCRLSIQDTQFCLSIEDNGKGFLPGGASKPSHGLANLRRRAEELGGRLTITSAPNAATTVKLEAPLP